MTDTINPERIAFNAGYCYGVENDASPEELDCAWELYCRDRRERALSRPALDVDSGAQANPSDWRALASRLNGLHAQMFGLASMDDPALAMQAIQDGGVLHEAVHDCLRALPVAALSRPTPDVPEAEEVEQIRARHEQTEAMLDMFGLPGKELHYDRATLLRLLDAARAELAAERAKDWQDISTAPKDQLIDIWIKHSDGTGVRWTSCYYDQICDQWRTAPGGHLMWVPAKAVSHWRHIPASPQP